ncbi:MAG: AAA family ATPase [Anaerolineae bacterium]|nr:AAA family ATPase [Anaerolineae bacterium]MDW8172750.1 adenylate/guanylate cyclase domain-containing protein [Anaerolineae bacterium]
MIKETKAQEIRQALAEVWQQRQHFSQETLGQITLALLDRLRRTQTRNHSAESTPTMDEIRLVTVMFIDVKDSTILAQELESDWKGVLAEAHRRISEVVTYWEGEIGQYLGDGVLCFFGAQRSRGDDALRCASCALAIHSAIDAYANDVFLTYGHDFAIRIGISTGRMVVGMVGAAAKQELLALGPATNLAARLQSLAAPGTTLVDSATYTRLRHHFSLKPRPAVKVKGYEQPIANYLLVGRLPRPSTQLTNAEVGDLFMPLAGRQAELEAILRACEQVKHFRRVDSLLVVGELGMGKSRLIQEALNLAADFHGLPIVVQASYELRGVSYNLIRHLLARQCGLHDDLSQEEAERLIVEQISANWPDPQAEMAAAILGYLGGYGFESHLAAQSLLRGGSRVEVAALWLGRYLRGQSEGATPLLVVDNLQWIDNDSLEVLLALLCDWREHPLMLLAAARPQWRESLPQAAVLFEGRQPIILDRLSDAETQELIRAVVGQVERVPSNLPEQISQRAEGNPLFVVEFLSMLFDNAVFHRDPRGRWRFNPIQYDAVAKNLPNGLLDVLQARLDDLPTEARSLVQMAAVGGQTFWAGMLRELNQSPVDAVLELLIRRGIIIPNSESNFEGEAQYSFRHALYRDVAYEMLPRAKREQYHRQVARWLVAHIANKPEYFGVLADQFTLGNQNEAALATYLEAAQNRAQRGFYGEVISLVDRALAMAKAVPRDVALATVAQLWAVRAQALIGLSRFDEARAAAQSAMQLLEELPNDQLVTVRVQAARLRGNACRSLGLYDEALEALSEAYELLDEDDNLLMASVLRSFGSLMLYRGRLTDSLAYQQRAYQHAEATQLDHQRYATLTQLGLLALERGQIGQAIETLEQVRNANEASGLTHLQVSDWRNLGQAYLALFNDQRARIAFEQAKNLNHRLGQQDTLLCALHALTLIRLGQVEVGLPTLWEVVRKPHRDVFNQHLVSLCLLEGLALVGDWVACLEQGHVLADRVRQDNVLLYGRVLMRSARAAHALGQSGALAMARRALDVELEQQGREIWYAHATLAEIVAEPHKRQHHARQALSALLALGETARHMRPIYATFQDSATVKALRNCAELP